MKKYLIKVVIQNKDGGYVGLVKGRINHVSKPADAIQFHTRESAEHYLEGYKDGAGRNNPDEYVKFEVIST